MRLVRAAVAASTLVLLLAAPPWLLVRYIGNPWPTGGVTLSAPLTDEAILGLLAAVVWLLWAQFAFCVIAETVAALSDDRLTVPAHGTFALQRQLARRLVATVVIATVATPVLGFGGAAAGPATPQHPVTSSLDALAPDPYSPRADLTQAPGTPTQVMDGASPGTVPADQSDLQQTIHNRSRASFRTVTVMRLDSLWSIAERELGSGERWPEIASLNEGRVMSDGVRFTAVDQIHPGWRLAVPAASSDGHVQASDREVATLRSSAGRGDIDSAQTRGDVGGVSPRSVTVEPGDSLWAIAADKLGGGNQWPRLYQANAETIGDNPNLIHPGQVVRLPITPPRDDTASADVAAGHNMADDTSTTSSSSPDSPSAEAEDGAQPVSVVEPTESTSHPPVADPNPSAPSSQPPDNPNGTGQDRSEPNDHDEDGAADLSAMRALLATTTFLAAGLGAALLANRRRQFRERRPGRIISEPTPHAARLERVIHDTQPSCRDDAEFVDLALRHLAQGQRLRQVPIPALHTARFDDTQLSLHFLGSHGQNPPPGWGTTDDGWALPRRHHLDSALRSQPAPFPALVSVGADDRGGTWMLDLEAQGTLVVTGADANEVLRFIAGELALNAWSEGIEVLLVDDTFPELVGLNPERIRRSETDPTLARVKALLTDDPAPAGPALLERRRDHETVDSTTPLTIISTSGPGRLDTVSSTGRCGVVLLRTHGDPTLVLTDDGRVRVVDRDVALTPFRLSAQQAEAMAQLLAATGQIADHAASPRDGQTPVSQLMNVDGSVRDDLTGPRQTDPDGATTVLPGRDENYANVAATASSDLPVLAPAVPEPSRTQLLAADPELDQDLRDWFDDQTTRPRITVLGPVDVAATHSDRATVANIGGTVEFVVYLACQERGVTKERAAEDLGWSGATVQNRARDARRVLGQRPDGGEWLPDAAKSESARRRGVATYQLHRDVLVDADLFRRVRTRAAARGSEGGDDLVLALSLVTGEPFEQLRRGGYGWLLEGDRLDHHMCAAIADVAHIVTTRALLESDLDLARRACQLGIRVNPYSDVARLDLAAVTEAEGGNPDDVVRRDVIDRVDADLTDRTNEVLRRRGWLAS